MSDKALNEMDAVEILLEYESRMLYFYSDPNSDEYLDGKDEARKNIYDRLARAQAAEARVAELEAKMDEIQTLELQCSAGNLDEFHTLEKIGRISRATLRETGE